MHMLSGGNREKPLTRDSMYSDIRELCRDLYNLVLYIGQEPRSLLQVLVRNPLWTVRSCRFRNSSAVQVQQTCLTAL